MSKQGVKAVYEAHLAGPVKVRVLAAYDNPKEVVVRVTSRTNRTYPSGHLFIAYVPFLFENHRFIGRLKCKSLYTGRPDLSGLPEATPKLLKQLEEQS